MKLRTGVEVKASRAQIDTIEKSVREYYNSFGIRRFRALVDSCAKSENARVSASAAKAYHVLGLTDEPSAARGNLVNVTFKPYVREVVAAMSDENVFCPLDPIP